MRTTNTERLTKSLGHNQKRNSLLVIAEEVIERVLDVTEEKDDLLLRLTDYNMS